MSFTKSTTYTLTIEVKQTLPDGIIEGVKSILSGYSSSPRIDAIKHLRHEVWDRCGHNPTLRDAIDIVDDIMSTMPKPKPEPEENPSLGKDLAQALNREI